MSTRASRFIKHYDAELLKRIDDSTAQFIKKYESWKNASSIFQGSDSSPEKDWEVVLRKWCVDPNVINDIRRSALTDNFAIHEDGCVIRIIDRETENAFHRIMSSNYKN